MREVRRQGSGYERRHFPPGVRQINHAVLHDAAINTHDLIVVRRGIGPVRLVARTCRRTSRMLSIVQKRGVRYSYGSGYPRNQSFRFRFP